MITFTVAPESGDPYEVTATSRDVYVWEKTSKGRSMSQLRADVRIEDLYRLAHLASKRLQLFTGSLEEFTESCDLEFEEDQDEGPTQPGASTGP